MNKVEWKHVELNIPPVDTWLLLWIRPTGPFQKRLYIQGKYIEKENESYFLSYKNERIETSKVYAWENLKEERSNG